MREAWKYVLKISTTIFLCLCDQAGRVGRELFSIRSGDRSVRVNEMSKNM
jgi:hypothetical protein